MKPAGARACLFQQRGRAQNTARRPSQAKTDRFTGKEFEMSKTKRGWLVVAAALALGASGLSRAGDGGAGGDSGDNGMNPMYGDSYATLEGQGHNAGSPRMAPQGAYAAHEMDGQM